MDGGNHWKINRFFKTNQKKKKRQKSSINCLRSFHFLFPLDGEGGIRRKHFIFAAVCLEEKPDLILREIGKGMIKLEKAKPQKRKGEKKWLKSSKPTEKKSPRYVSSESNMGTRTGSTALSEANGTNGLKTGGLKNWKNLNRRKTRKPTPSLA